MKRRLFSFFPLVVISVSAIFPSIGYSEGFSQSAYAACKPSSQHDAQNLVQKGNAWVAKDIPVFVTCNVPKPIGKAIKEIEIRYDRELDPFERAYPSCFLDHYDRYDRLKSRRTELLVPGIATYKLNIPPIQFNAGTIQFQCVMQFNDRFLGFTYKW